MALKHVQRSLSITVLAGILLQGCVTAESLREPSTINRLESADAAFQAGALKKAQQEYIAITEKSPELISPYFRLGLIAYGQDQFEQAQAYYEAVLARDAEHAPATYNLAIIHLEQARRLLYQHEKLDHSAANDRKLLEIRRSIEALGQPTEADG